ADEAVRIRRELARRSPTAQLSGLADSLDNLARRLVSSVDPGAASVSGPVRERGCRAASRCSRLGSAAGRSVSGRSS
ncbi:hypothetical protein AB0E04_47580, partial [Streptomyces sp. NPDC048251]|uniref:hypothetical protein n=1 Tax=Streptomyces sp. NPDC048251 TaxID=3154501 RepID=UPI0034354CA7